jgi:cobalt-zinc-cadmium efflux system outer membrane protein
MTAAETTLALSSVIELGGKRNARLSVANAQLQTFDYHRQAFTLDVLGELTSTFIQALEVQALSELAAEARDLAQSTLMIVKDRSLQGAAPESEVKRAKSTLSQAQLQVDALKQQFQRLQIKIAAYWGETLPHWSTLDGDIYTYGAASDFSDLYERAKSSPAIAQFASEARLKKAEVSLAKTQSKADLSWQLGIRRFEDSGDTAFTAGVSIPLFTGKRNRGALKSAMASENEVVYERQTALLKLHVQLFEAYSQREQHVAAVKVFRSTILPDLNAALASTKRAYETGRYSYQDWIAAQKELLDAKRSLIESAATASLNQAVIEQLIAEPLN